MKDVLHRIACSHELTGKAVTFGTEKCSMAMKICNKNPMSMGFLFFDKTCILHHSKPANLNGPSMPADSSTFLEDLP